MASKKKSRGRGRPQLYSLTSNQERSIRSRVEHGETSKEIISSMGIHPYALLRVRRAMNKKNKEKN